MIWKTKKALQDKQENFPRDFLPVQTTTRIEGIVQK